jgi:hypothetical protein
VSTFLNFLSPRSFTYSPKTIGTEFLAYREKIEVTRSGSPFERSPVAMGRANRRYTRLFCALPWRMPQI